MTKKTIKVTNYKGIRGTIETDLHGSVIVQGKNAAGKSSFIDAITELFDARGVRLTPQPVNLGNEEASAEYVNPDLDVRIVRTWKDKDGKVSSQLSVYSLDGAKYSKPAEVIANLTGGLIFDPTRFLQLDPKPQRDALLQKVQFTDAEFDLERLDSEQRAAEENRLHAFQVKQAALGAVANAEKPPADTPANPVSTVALAAEVTKIQQQNQLRKEQEQRLQDAELEGNKQLQQVEEFLILLNNAKKQLQEIEQKQSALRSAIAELPDYSDTAGLEEKIRNVDEINRNVQLRQILTRLEAEAQAKVIEHEEAEQYVQSFVQKKKDALSKAIFPDPNLSVDDGQVLYDGIPFSQVNTASQRKAAFSIATSGNPDLKLCIVKDGDLLDEDSLSELSNVASARGFDVLIERGRTDVAGLVATFVELEDGQVKE